MGGVESTERQERFSLSNETSQRDLAKQLRDLSLQQSLSFSGQPFASPPSHSTSELNMNDPGSSNENNPSSQREGLDRCRIERASEGIYAESSKNLLVDTALRCGHFKGSKCRNHCSIGSILASRELGIRWRGCCMKSNRYGSLASLNNQDRIEIKNRFFPNKIDTVDQVRTKTFCVSHIGDGNSFLTASQDHKIRLYEKYENNYVPQKTYEVPYVGWSILDVAVSPDGRDIVYSTWDDAMYQCRIDDPSDCFNPLRVDAQEQRFALFSIKFNSDGTEIVGGATDKHLYIYNREVNRCVLTLRAHEDDVNAVCFGDQSSNIILSGADDGLVHVWDRRTMGAYGGSDPVGSFAGHCDGITYIDSRGDDRYILSNSKDQSIKVWDLRHMASKDAMDESMDAVRSQQWDYRYQKVPHESKEQFGKKLAGDCSVVTMRGHSVLHTLIRAKFSPENTGRRYVYAGCAAGNCYVYDLYDGKTIKKLGGHRSVVRDLSWNPSTGEIITCGWDGLTYLWDFGSSESTSHAPNHSHLKRKRRLEQKFN